MYQIVLAFEQFLLDYELITTCWMPENCTHWQMGIVMLHISR